MLLYRLTLNWEVSDDMSEEDMDSLSEVIADIAEILKDVAKAKTPSQVIIKTQD